MLSAGSGCGCSMSPKTGPVEAHRAVKPRRGGGIQLVAHLVLPGDFWKREGLEQECVCRAGQASQQLRAGCRSEPAGSRLQQSQFVHRCGLKNTQEYIYPRASVESSKAAERFTDHKLGTCCCCPPKADISSSSLRMPRQGLVPGWWWEQSR